ncbi:hypothetical protein [Pseudoduganella namucuonensis]|uniref:Uncharacterized protein n=1 Tax=Pseudoduganella namucuonensis TaxID=1035707 RepID=A0A1I7JR63_9BURK|nr:hypothetical protein [Pseudoduganella namucuonensis]SFU87673.1 hypothetical protein SAMN05216552_1012176 [Pseudoduganella namucuonensis]
MEPGRHSARPELFAPPLAATGGERRILATLDHGDADAGRRLPPHARHLALALGAMLVLACGVAWISHIAITPRNSPEFAITSYQAPAAATPVEVEKLAAAIINEPLQAAAARMPGPARAAPATAATVADRPPQARGKASVQAKRDGNGVKAGARHAATVADLQPERAGAARGPAGKDSDVTLLAALVAHGSGAASVPAGAADGATALQGCERLRASEAALCRMRVCGSQWQHEAGCRQAAARDSD